MFIKFTTDNLYVGVIASHIVAVANKQGGFNAYGNEKGKYLFINENGENRSVLHGGKSFDLVSGPRGENFVGILNTSYKTLTQHLELGEKVEVPKTLIREIARKIKTGDNQFIISML